VNSEAAGSARTAVAAVDRIGHVVGSLETVVVDRNYHDLFDTDRHDESEETSGGSICWDCHSSPSCNQKLLLVIKVVGTAGAGSAGGGDGAVRRGRPPVRRNKLIDVNCTVSAPSAIMAS
jgi:hypothetical protein